MTSKKRALSKKELRVMALARDDDSRKSLSDLVDSLVKDADNSAKESDK